MGLPVLLTANVGMRAEKILSPELKASSRETTAKACCLPLRGVSKKTMSMQQSLDSCNSSIHIEITNIKYWLLHNTYQAICIYFIEKKKKNTKIKKIVMAATETDVQRA